MHALTQPCAPLRILAQDHSLEITTKDIAELVKASPAIPAGTQISVTFLPGEDWRARVAAAAEVRRLGFMPMPHIAARNLGSRQELEDLLALLRERAAIDRAFVIAGDMAISQGPYDDALSIIRTGMLGKYGVKMAGIAGYPDGHPKIDTAKLWQALLDKRAALKDFAQPFEIVTQFGFDAGAFLKWIEQARDTGIEERIRIGIPGPASVRTLVRFATRCGVSASAKVMAKYGLSLTKLMGSAGPDELLAELEAKLDIKVHGQTSLHFYPFGGVGRTIEYIRSFARID